MDRAATGFVDYRDTDRETGKSAVCVTESLPAALSSSVVTRRNEVGTWSREYQGNRPDEKLKIDRAETFSLGRYRQSMEIDGQVSRAFPAELSSLPLSLFFFFFFFFYSTDADDVEETEEDEEAEEEEGKEKEVKEEGRGKRRRSRSRRRVKKKRSGRES